MFGISAFSENPFSALGPLALTGVSATGAVGTVTYAITLALSGVQASGNVGTVFPVYWILVNTS